MKKKIINLQTKIFIMISGVIFISISFIFPFLVKLISDEIQSKVEINVMNIAEIVAKTSLVQEKLLLKDSDGTIQIYINNLMKNVENIKFIVVADMNGIRYSHPNPERIGERFKGGDERRVVENAETYISKAEGTLGISFRALTPIYYDNKQIGFVSVGTLEENVNKAMNVATKNLFLFSFIGFMIGTIGTVFLTASIKKSLLGLEPDEISKLYNDKTGMLEAISEGVIAIDRDENITLINDAALNIIQFDKRYTKNKLLGKNILEYFDTTQLPNILKTGEAEYDKEMIINNTIILANRVPIKNKGKIVGAMATFRDKTEFTNLAEEVTGVKQIIEALRANTHEFSNKLHVILGLLHLKEIDEAKKYIKSVSDNQEENLSLVTSRIKEPTIAGLLLGKISRAKELNIDLEINEDSYYVNDTDINKHVFVTILGNLLENAFEAVSKTANDEKFVYFKIIENEEIIEIDIEDNGVGIEKDKIDEIFKRGYTTKQNSKGVGLDLVRRVVKSLDGKIRVDSDEGIGTYFNIIIPKNQIS